MTQSEKEIVQILQNVRVGLRQRAEFANKNGNAALSVDLFNQCNGAADAQIAVMHYIYARQQSTLQPYPVRNLDEERNNAA